MGNGILYGLISIIAIIPTFFSSAKSNSDADNYVNERKSHYVFMEAMRKKAIGEYDSYHELLRYAYSLDTTNTAIAHHLGYSNLIKGSFSNEQAQQYLALMESHFRSTPEDYHESYVYGDICRKLNMNKRALTVWEKLHELYPNKQDVMAQLADAHATAKNFAKAIELFDTIESRQCMSIPITLMFSLQKITIDLSCDKVEIFYLVNYSKNDKDLHFNWIIYPSEIESVEVVELSKEEKRKYTSAKFLFSKYLKITMKYGHTKYVYVSHYSDDQIKNIIQMLTSHKKI
jgi:tetratricopeptide (TPR) repeat protein